MLEVAELERAFGSRRAVARVTFSLAAGLKLLIAFDIVFIAACTLAYPFTVED